MPLLFSYGTLRLPAVQSELFGRAVVEYADSLTGFHVTHIRIADARVVRLSGSAEHLMLQASGRPTDRVDGAVLELTDEELRIADAYETSQYRRVAVLTANGRQAFVYVAASGDS